MYHHADVFIHFKVVKAEFIKVHLRILLLNLRNQAKLYFTFEGF